MASGDRRPVGARPVKRIELSEGESKKRIILTAIFILIAVISFSVFLFSILVTEPGWKTIECENPNEISGDFVFNYYIGGAEASPDEDQRELSILYGRMTSYAAHLFDAHTEASGMNNLATINLHPGEEIEVDELLYHSLKTAHEAGRQIYLGAILDDYRTQMLIYDTTFGGVEMDPSENSEMAEYYRTMAQFACSSEHISLEFSEPDKVKLVLSDEYLSFAEDKEITVFVDFFRLKNAFIIDYMADELIDKGYTLGNITSFDGYVRNLDDGDNTFYYNIFDRADNNIYRAATLEYKGRTAVVTMRNYPMGENDSYFYSTNSKGGEVTPYVDVSDGMYKSSTDNIVAYSHSLRCADIALALWDIYVSDSLDDGALMDAADSGIMCVWGESDTLLYNHGDVSLVDIYSDGEISYSAKKLEA